MVRGIALLEQCLKPRRGLPAFSTWQNLLPWRLHFGLKPQRGLPTFSTLRRTMLPLTNSRSQTPKGITNLFYFSEGGHNVDACCLKPRRGLPAFSTFGGGTNNVTTKLSQTPKGITGLFYARKIYLLKSGSKSLKPRRGLPAFSTKWGHPPPAAELLSLKPRRGLPAFSTYVVNGNPGTGTRVSNPKGDYRPFLHESVSVQVATALSLKPQRGLPAFSTFWRGGRR